MLYAIVWQLYTSTVALPRGQLLILHWRTCPPCQLGGYNAAYMFNNYKNRASDLLEARNPFAQKG
jgi:hypothetical protein